MSGFWMSHTIGLLQSAPDQPAHLALAHHIARHMWDVKMENACKKRVQNDVEEVPYRTRERESGVAAQGPDSPGPEVVAVA